VAGGRKLDEYQRKRDFAATPEPRGVPPDAAGTGRFVIQQHSATRLHWDLRLEHEGVLLSWALPRGLPWDPERNHLAVHTEDHPIEYLTFAGDIPSGSYGAGSMFVWDTGTYEAEKIEDTKVVFTLDGGRPESAGTYALFRTRGRDWMIHRMTPPLDPARRHLPDRFDLVTPAPGPRPRSGSSTWALETRWRGLRAVLTASGGIVDLQGPEGGAITDWFPEVRPVGRVLGYTEVALDGILTVPAADPERLRRRLAAGSESTRRRLSRDAPVTYVAVDLLWQDGHPLVDRPWSGRREALEALGLDGGAAHGGEAAWTVPAAYTGDPAPMLAAARKSGVSSLVAKRVDAPYDPTADPPPWRIVDLG
jgi:bifunctional non-homologous end joining protein LigD